MEEADVVFAHLQELMDQIPEMEALGARLDAARAAQAVVDADAHRVGQVNQEAHIKSYVDGYMAEREEALAKGDAEAERAAREAALQCGNMLAIRKGAREDAERKLAAALEAGGFSSVDAAREAVMPAGELEEETERLRAFQADYAQTLQRARELEPASEA
ncbi:MAG: hypothetical protein K6F70_07465 [Eggerthellaceae bacterium]|nr:hypothetical protein [Eggerthellaceae bacterium]